VLDNFTDQSADDVLFVACNDFGRVAEGAPIEAQVFEAWYLAQAFARVSDVPLRAQDLVRSCIRFFPGIRTAERATKLSLGRAALDRLKDDPAYRMNIKREVVLPDY
jgi:hypothetical protein